MKIDLTGRVALVTGASRGIGREIAKALAGAGAKVACVATNEELLKSLVAEIGGGAIALKCDISKPAEIEATVETAAKELGGLDILVNNAGVYPLAPLAKMSDEDLHGAFAINVVAPMALIRDAIPALQASGGVVVNIGSTVARLAKPNRAAYISSKLALEQATRCLAVELGPLGIRVNCVAPGMTSTDMIANMPTSMRQDYLAATPLGRVGEPEEIARVVLALASDDFAWVTGQVIQCSGGFQL